jgi:type IV pilus assembly protein PilV
MRPFPSHRSQKGTSLLEALVAILIFSTGVLAIVGVQAKSVALVSSTKFRSEAGLLADRIVSEMWVNSPNVANYVYPGSGAVPPVLAGATGWLNAVTSSLPGATSHPPQIALSNVGGSNQVTVTIFWQSPGEGGVVHKHSLIAYIN